VSVKITISVIKGHCYGWFDESSFLQFAAKLVERSDSIMLPHVAHLGFKLIRLETGEQRDTVGAYAVVAEDSELRCDASAGAWQA
jgi:hypothetical protein